MELTARLDGLLRPVGFFRRKQTWNRKLPPFVDVIDIQSDKFLENMTINAGVLHPEIHMKCWHKPLPDVIQEPDCIVRSRIGGLIDDRDVWWNYDATDLIKSVTENVCKYVLPFLDSMHSLEAMEQFLTKEQVTKKRYPPPIIYLALLKHARGDRSGACDILTELADQSWDPWKSHVITVAQQLGCP